MLTADRFIRSGKVRDLYEVPDGRLLLVASDRISAFDVVLPTAIPDKGRVLTGLSRFWFAETAGIVPNHLLDTDVAIIRDAYDEAAGGETGDREGRSIDDLRGRVLICQPSTVVPIEAVVRGYLAGSGWKEYQERGTVCGIPLPSGLRESDRLPEPIFTPATKAEHGEHDENIDFDTMIRHIGRNWIIPPDFAGPLAEVVRDQSIALYRYGSAIAARGGILLADTKFEFGVGMGPAQGNGPVGPTAEQMDVPTRSLSGRRPADVNGHLIKDQLILVDEALTPDSSRFWDAATYEPGRPQASFDKQFVRDWLEAQPWDKTAPGPALPDEVVDGTRARYVEAFERITGASFDRYLADDVIGEMTTHRFAVNVTPKPGILDPQGRAVEGSLAHLGIDGVSAVRVGRRVELTVEAADASAARAVVERMSSELLSNPLIEAYTIESIAGASSTTSTPASPSAAAEAR